MTKHIAVAQFALCLLVPKQEPPIFESFLFLLLAVLLLLLLLALTFPSLKSPREHAASAPVLLPPSFRPRQYCAASHCDSPLARSTARFVLSICFIKVPLCESIVALFILLSSLPFFPCILAKGAPFS